VNFAQARTGCGGYFGSDGSRHIKNVDPLALSTSRTWTQRWQIESAKGTGLLPSDTTL